MEKLTLSLKAARIGECQVKRKSFDPCMSETVLGVLTHPLRVICVA